MSCWTLTLPNWMPASDNRFNAHWSVRFRLKREDQYLVAAYADAQQIPKARGKRRVSIRITTGQRRKPPDPTNLLKSLLDALVRCQLLTDDSADDYQLGEIVVERGGERQTVVTLEEV